MRAGLLEQQSKELKKILIKKNNNTQKPKNQNVKTGQNYQK